MHGNLRNHHLLLSVSPSSSNKSARHQQQQQQQQQQLDKSDYDNEQQVGDITTMIEGALRGKQSPVRHRRFHQQQARKLAGDSRDCDCASSLSERRKFCLEQMVSQSKRLLMEKNGTTKTLSKSNNDIRYFTELIRHQQQELRPASLSITAAQQQRSIGVNVGAGDGIGSGPETAANAMVNMVRLILLILISVLLVKLRAPKSVRLGFKGKALRNNDKNQYDDDDSQCKILDDNLIGLSSEPQQQDNEDDTKSRTLINSTGQQHKRRTSQPELMSRDESSEFNRKREQAERRRRHSDTSLAHLKLPPGPMGLPFLGYLPFVGQEIHLTLTSLSERFGPIYQIFLGGIRVVVLNDASLVRQAFRQPVFSGRPDTQLTRILQGYGIVNSDGALWKEQRAFLHSTLRKLGAKSLMNGSNGLEAKIQNQVKEFVNDLSVHANEGKPCQVRPIVARAVSSVVGSIVMNLTYRKYEEKEKFDRLIELMQEGFRLFSIAMPLDFIPIFRFLPGVSYAYKKMKRNRAETSAFFQGVADEHRKYLSQTFNLEANSLINSPLHPKSNSTTEQSSQPTAASVSAAPAAASASPQTTGSSKQHDHNTKATTGAALAAQAGAAPGKQHVELEKIVARDLVDAYIVQQKKHEKDGKENYFSDQQLVQIMSDIFSAGLETVTSTIEWSILFLILNTKCQEQIQCEIDKVIGRDRAPELEHLSQMPYTEATIYEVLRRSNVVALGNAHATLDDATIGGYLIPKGTQVLPNLYGIHMNPKLWHEPDRFDPERFIVNERAHKPDYFIPFSVGRRMCLGDLLAKMEVFLFLVGLLQKYDLSVAEEDKHCPPQVKGTIGVSNTPASFRVALHCRATTSNRARQQQELPVATAEQDA